MNMPKYNYLILLILLLCVCEVKAQTYNGADSVKKYRGIYNSNKSDYNLGMLYHFKSNYYRGVNADSALYYANLFLDIAKKIKSTKSSGALRTSNRYFLIAVYSRKLYP